MDTAVFATLKKLIGKKTDSTDETVNGKLNTVINNTSASTSANAGGTLAKRYECEFYQRDQSYLGETLPPCKG